MWQTRRIMKHLETSEDHFHNRACIVEDLTVSCVPPQPTGRRFLLASQVSSTPEECLEWKRRLVGERKEGTYETTDGLDQKETAREERTRQGTYARLKGRAPKGREGRARDFRIQRRVLLVWSLSNFNEIKPMEAISHDLYLQ